MIEHIRIPAKDGLDGIDVYIEEHGGASEGHGRGRIIIDGFGEAYSHYWSNMGHATVRHFFAHAGEQYLADKLWPNWVPRTRQLMRHHMPYLRQIVTRVQAALKEQSQ